eukprot:2853793-Amphidinium_carterae.1
MMLGMPEDALSKRPKQCRGNLRYTNLSGFQEYPDLDNADLQAAQIRQQCLSNQGCCIAESLRLSIRGPSGISLLDSFLDEHVSDGTRESTRNQEAPLSDTSSPGSTQSDKEALFQ